MRTKLQKNKHFGVTYDIQTIASPQSPPLVGDSVLTETLSNTEPYGTSGCFELSSHGKEYSVLAGLCSYINLDFLLLIMQQKLVLFSLLDMYLKVSSFAMCNVESEPLNTFQGK